MPNMRRGASSPSPSRARPPKRPRYTANRVGDDSDEDIITPPVVGTQQGPSNVPRGQDPFCSASQKKKKRRLGGGGRPILPNYASAPGPSRNTQKQRRERPVARASNAQGAGPAETIVISSDEESTPSRGPSASQPARGQPQAAAARAPPATQPVRGRQSTSSAPAPTVTQGAHGRGILEESFYTGPKRAKANDRNARAAQLNRNANASREGGDNARASGSGGARASGSASANANDNRASDDRSSSFSPPATISTQPRRRPSPPRPPPVAAGTKEDAIVIDMSDEEPAPPLTQNRSTVGAGRSKAPADHISDDEIDFTSPVRRQNNNSSSDIEIISPQPARSQPAEPEFEPEHMEDPFDMMRDDSMPPPPSPPQAEPTSVSTSKDSISATRPVPSSASQPRPRPVASRVNPAPAITTPTPASQVGPSTTRKVSPITVPKPSRATSDIQPPPPAPKPAQVALPPTPSAKEPIPPASPTRETTETLESPPPPARTPTPPTHSRATSYDSIEDMYAEPHPSASNRRLLDSSPSPRTPSPPPAPPAQPVAVQEPVSQVTPVPKKRPVPRMVRKPTPQDLSAAPAQSMVLPPTATTKATPKPPPRPAPEDVAQRKSPPPKHVDLQPERSEQPAPQAPTRAPISVSTSQVTARPTQRSPILPLRLQSVFDPPPSLPSSPPSSIKNAFASPSKLTPRPVGAAATVPVASTTTLPTAPLRRAASVAAWTTLAQEEDSQETDKDKLGVDVPKEEEEEEDLMDELRTSSPEAGEKQAPIVKKKHMRRKKPAAKEARDVIGKTLSAGEASQPLASPLVLKPQQAGPTTQPAPLKLRPEMGNTLSQPAQQPAVTPQTRQHLASPFVTPAPKPTQPPSDDVEMRSPSPPASEPMYIEVRDRTRSGSVSLRVGIEETPPDEVPPLVLRLPGTEGSAASTRAPTPLSQSGGEASKAAVAADAAHKETDKVVAPPVKAAEAAAAIAKTLPTPLVTESAPKPPSSQQQHAVLSTSAQPIAASVPATLAKPASIPGAAAASSSTSMPPPSTPIPRRVGSLAKLMAAQGRTPRRTSGSKPLFQMRPVPDRLPDSEDGVPRQTSISGRPVPSPESISPPVSRVTKNPMLRTTESPSPSPATGASANKDAPVTPISTSSSAPVATHSGTPAVTNTTYSEAPQSPTKAPATPTPSTSQSAAPMLNTVPTQSSRAPPPPRISTSATLPAVGPSSAPAVSGSSGPQKRRVTWDDLHAAKRAKHSNLASVAGTASPTTSVPSSPTESRGQRTVPSSPVIADTPTRPPLQPTATAPAAAPAATPTRPSLPVAQSTPSKPWFLRMMEENQRRGNSGLGRPVVAAPPSSAVADVQPPTPAKSTQRTPSTPRSASMSDSAKSSSTVRPAQPQVSAPTPKPTAPPVSAAPTTSAPASSDSTSTRPTVVATQAKSVPSPSLTQHTTPVQAASIEAKEAAPVAGPSQPPAPVQTSSYADDDEDLSLIYPPDEDESSPEPPSAHTATPSPSRESSVEQPEQPLRRSLRRQVLTSKAASRSSSEQATRRSSRNATATPKTSSKATTPAESVVTDTPPPVPELSRGSSDTDDDGPLLTPTKDLGYDPHSGASIKGPFYDKVVNGCTAVTLTPARILHDNPPVVRHGRDLPHLLMDRMCSLPERYRGDDTALLILKSRVNEETFAAEEEAPPIDVVNDIDDESKVPPWEFYYTNEMWLGNAVPPPDLENLRGCSCKGKCDPKSGTCRCIKIQERRYMADDSPEKTGFVYDPRTGRLKKGIPENIPIYECNDLCGCLEDCPNRVVQRGRQYPIVIKKTVHKGWGVFANGRRIPQNSYIGIYAGELLSDEEAEDRAEIYDKYGRTYLLEIKYWYINRPKDMPLDQIPEEEDAKFVVDAYHAGNFTRFMNHSCDPNCRILPCYINEANDRKPLLTFWTTRDIGAEEELTFSYLGPPDEEEEQPTTSKKGKGKAKKVDVPDDAVFAKCYCGAKKCRKVLFK